MENLKRVRLAKGWTRYRLMKTAGVLFRTIVMAEDHGRDMRWSTAVKMADALGCSLDELAGRTPPKAA